MPSRCPVRTGRVRTSCGRSRVGATARRRRWRVSSRLSPSHACSPVLPGDASERSPGSRRKRGGSSRSRRFLPRVRTGRPRSKHLLEITGSTEHPGIVVACTHGDVLVGVIDELVSSEAFEGSPSVIPKGGAVRLDVAAGTIVDVSLLPAPESRATVRTGPSRADQGRPARGCPPSRLPPVCAWMLTGRPIRAQPGPARGTGLSTSQGRSDG